MSELLGIVALEHPARGLVGLALAAAVLFLALRSRPAAIPWPAMAEARAAGARRDVTRLVSLLLRAGALAALALALAGPLGAPRAPLTEVPGLDVVLVLDASASMRALDTSRGGEARTRFALARDVVARFAERRAAEGDRVGLVVFGETAFTQTPLTRDGPLLAAALQRLEPGIAGDATALGDALALAVKRATRGADPDARAGRLVVLLTDGRSNAGHIPVDVATSLALRAGVRVHTVGIGSAGEVPIAGPDGAHAVRFERHDPDSRTLQAIADGSGGLYFPARRPDDLAEVYAAIDSFERVPRPAPRAARPERRAGGVLALAGLLLGLELGIARVGARRLP